MDILGYDCDGQEIYEYRILVGIWVGDVDIRDLPDTDPRIYCALVGDDGNAYAISVYDYGNDDMDFRAKLIREREHIPDGEPIPTIIKPIEEMENYEVAFHWDGSQGMNIWEYEEDREELKKLLNKLLKKQKGQSYTKTRRINEGK